MEINNYVKISPDDLNLLKEKLIDEGFYDPWFAQEWKDDQVFGLAKEIRAPFEWHIRAFKEGTLDSEIEISRRYLGHKSMPAKPFHNSLVKILHKHRIRFVLTEVLPPDPQEMSPPSTLVDWIPLAEFFFGHLFRLFGVFIEKNKQANSADYEKIVQVNFKRLMLAALMLSVPLRIVANILLLIPNGTRLKVLDGLRQIAMIRPPGLSFVSSISQLNIREDQKKLFKNFVDSLKLNKLAEL